MSESAAFAGEGFTSFPSLYFDNRDVAQLSERSTEQLEEMLREYETFRANQEPLMHRADETSNRIIEHLVFELLWRQGAFSEMTNKDLDELCEELN